MTKKQLLEIILEKQNKYVDLLMRNKFGKVK